MTWSMVGGGVGEQDEGADHEHRAGPFESGLFGQTDQHDACRERQGSGNRVDPAAHGGLRPAVHVVTALARLLLLVQLGKVDAFDLGRLDFALGDNAFGFDFGFQPDLLCFELGAGAHPFGFRCDGLVMRFHYRGLFACDLRFCAVVLFGF